VIDLNARASHPRPEPNRLVSSRTASRTSQTFPTSPPSVDATPTRSVLFHSPKRVMSRVAAPRARASPSSRARAPARPGRCGVSGFSPSSSIVDARRRLPRASSASDGANGADVVSSARPGDVIRFTLVDDDASTLAMGTARMRFLEVTATTATTATGQSRGRACELRVTSSGVTYEELEESARPNERRGGERGADGPLEGRLVEATFTRRFPGWATLLDGLARSETYPAKRDERTRACEDVARVCSLDALRARVDEDASFWVDGSSKDFAGLSADEHALLNAGEIIAFQRGLRPMCMVQLWTGWEDDKVSNQNVDLPFVARLLREVTEDEKIEVITVSPPNATDALGLTAILYPNRSPHRERAKFLASFGAQAAIVAGSPYYQTLIGRCLGYKEENIEAHVRQYNKGAPISKQVSDLVDEELQSISPVPPTKNWREDFPEIKRTGSRKKKNSRRQTSNVEDVEMMFGRRRSR